MSLTEATDATPRQMVAFIDAGGPYRLAVTSAWHSEFFARQKKLQPLETYLRNREPAKKLSGRERAAIARAEAAAWNARVAKSEARKADRDNKGGA